MIRDRRRQIFRIPATKIPPRLYTNSGESINNKMRARKTALGFSKKEDVTKAFFLKNIWLHCVEEQNLEIEKALRNQSADFRLAAHANHLALSEEEYQEMSEAERHRYVSSFRSISNENIEKRKSIQREAASASHQKALIQNLGICLPSMLPGLLHADEVQRKALFLLNHETAISPAPSIDQGSKVSYFVAGKSGTTHRVSVSSLLNIRCSCLGYSHSAICGHSLAIAHKESIVTEFCTKVKGKRKYLGRVSLLADGSARGVGRKGQQCRKKRKYSSLEREENKGPFTEVWHNNLPIILVPVNEVPKDKTTGQYKTCGECRKDFPRGPLSIIPHNVVGMHSERWEYFVTNLGKVQVSKKLTTKYYHLKPCIRDRFPYITNHLLEVRAKITQSHVDLLKAELGITVTI